MSHWIRISKRFDKPNDFSWVNKKPIKIDIPDSDEPTNWKPESRCDAISWNEQKCNCRCDSEWTCTITADSWQGKNRTRWNRNGSPCDNAYGHYDHQQKYWDKIRNKEKLVINTIIKTGQIVCHECHHKAHDLTSVLIADDDPLALYRNYQKKKPKPKIVFKYKQIHKYFTAIVNYCQKQNPSFSRKEEEELWNVFITLIFIHEATHHLIQNYIQIITKQPVKKEIRNPNKFLSSHLEQQDEEKLCEYIANSYIYNNREFIIPNSYVLLESYVLFPPKGASTSIRNKSSLTQIINDAIDQQIKLPYRRETRRKYLNIINGALGRSNIKKPSKYWPSVTSNAVNFINESPELFNLLLDLHFNHKSKQVDTLLTTLNIKKHEIKSNIVSELDFNKKMKLDDWFKKFTNYPSHYQNHLRNEIHTFNLKNASSLQKRITTKITRVTNKIKLSEICLDPYNPRIYQHLKTKYSDKAIAKISQDKLLDIYLKQEKNTIDKHKTSITINGILDPIFLVKSTNKKCKYIVKEGNVRIAILKDLERQGNLHLFPIPAYVYHPSISDNEISMHLLSLQTGKHKWLNFEKAHYYKRIIKEDRFSIGEISRIFNIPLLNIKREIEAYNLFLDYQNWYSTKSLDFSKFEEIIKHKNIFNWVNQSKNNRQDFCLALNKIFPITTLELKKLLKHLSNDPYFPKELNEFLKRPRKFRRL